jgi:hypothetical protein
VSSPPLSVLMPVFDGDRYLAGALNSVLAQSFADFELVAVDDGSHDGSLATLERFASRDDRIRVLARPHRGLVAALNDGLDACRGRLIARMDADDLCHPERFHRQIERMEAEPGLIALGTQAALIDADGRPLGRFVVPPGHDDIEAQHLTGCSSIHHPSVMMRATAVRKVGGYREHCFPAEDFDLWLRLGETGRLANLAEPLVTLRLRLDGVVATTAARQTETVGLILREAWQRRGIAGAPVCPTIGLVSPADRLRQWAWLALRDGSAASARRYAIKALVAEPLESESWRLLFCAVRGR